MTPKVTARAVFVDYQGSVRIVINDESVIARCVENHDDEGVPQSDVRGGTGWRNLFYDLDTEADVFAHLAYNCALNGIERVNRLDGWADLRDDAATMTNEAHVWTTI